MPEEKDETVADVINDNQDATHKSGESDKELSLDKVAQIAKATQKGYTATRQEIAQIKETMQNLVDAISQKQEAQGQSPYVTEQRLKEIFVEIQSQQEALKTQANEYIETTLDSLKEDGVIEKGEEEALMQFALRIKEPDLEKAATTWKEAKNQVSKTLTKKQERQEAGSKVGTSSKSEGGQEKKGVSYAEIRKMQDWYGN